MTDPCCTGLMMVRPSPKDLAPFVQVTNVLGIIEEHAPREREAVLAKIAETEALLDGLKLYLATLEGVHDQAGVPLRGQNG